MRPHALPALLLALPLLMASDCGGGGKGDPCLDDTECGLAYACYQPDFPEEGICLLPEQIPDTDTSD